tara:strand:- start:118 stop:318 length:201 start_codon:yes stop_codon:yes gene_type:complete
MSNTKKLKHDADHILVDLIMEHFNTQSLEGLKENLSGEQFNEILEVAKDMYYMEILKSMKHDLPKG